MTLSIRAVGGAWRAATVLVLAGFACGMCGCAVAGWAGKVVGADRTVVTVDAEYEGLGGRDLAILVATDGTTSAQFPRAGARAARVMGAEIARNVPATKLIEPDRIDTFVDANPYWHSMPYSDVMDALGADRLLVVDVSRFTTRDQEHRHLWRGSIAADVHVVERESSNPDAYAYSQAVRAVYPQRPVPLLEHDEQTIQFGLLRTFSERAASLFYRHKEVR
ncbi:MAG: hypothetical protein CMJ18_17305 [Phycisphaeraceae bacterium]|nr:hypothetical protein [Phycisphaeraceae bacterium]